MLRVWGLGLRDVFLLGLCESTMKEDRVRLEKLLLRDLR